MADGYKPIARCQEGGDSLISAEYANKLIDMLNAIGNGTVAPIANVGSFKLAGGTYILDLSLVDGRLSRLEGFPVIPAGGTANQVLGKLSGNNYDIGWINVSANNGGGASYPPGGNTGWALVKNSAANNDVKWSNNILTEDRIMLLQNTLNALIASINNSSGNLTCDGNNGGTMTMNYPGLPNVIS